MTYYIDDLKPGMSESFTKTVTERDIQLFGEVTGDINPGAFRRGIRQDHDVQGPHRPRRAVGGYISTVLGMKMPGPGTIFMSPDHALQGAGAHRRHGRRRPARCARSNAEKRRVIFDCVCKVGDTTVVEGEAMVMAPSRPKA